MSTIIMATTPTCTRCRHIARYLTKRGVAFENISVADCAELHELVTALGYKQAPVFLRLDTDAPADAPLFRGVPVAEHTATYEPKRIRTWAEVQLAA